MNALTRLSLQRITMIAAGLSVSGEQLARKITAKR
jgi:hypothetical protein